MSYLKQIKKYCDWCCNGSFTERDLCLSEDCVFYSFRHGKRGESKLTPLKAIKARCKDCKPDSWNEVKECKEDCFLHEYRLGKNPKLKGKRGKGNMANLIKKHQNN